MPVRKGNHSKRRYMYFRESSKRDPAISQEEERERYDMAICQFCQSCMEKHDLFKGKIPRKLGVCGICGSDSFVTGSLYNDDESIVLAKRLAGIPHYSKEK